MDPTYPAELLDDCGVRKLPAQAIAANVAQGLGMTPYSPSSNQDCDPTGHDRCQALTKDPLRCSARLFLRLQRLLDLLGFLATPLLPFRRTVLLQLQLWVVGD